MNIAIISPWAISKTSVGGTERFTIDLASQLLALGDEVEVFMLSGESCNIGGVVYTSLNILGRGKVANEYDLRAYADNSTGESFYSKWARYLESAIDGSRFDFIQLNSLLFIDAWPNKPRLFTIHTNPFEYQLDWGKERLESITRKIRKLLPHKTLLAAPSSHYGKQFSRLFRREVLAIPHAIDAARLNSLSTHGRQYHSERDITILLPSRIELVQKRPQTVFRGIALLPEYQRRRVRIVASGKDSQYLDNCKKMERIARSNGFEADFTRFPSMAEAYAMADIVALPSRSESFGYAALESLTLGIPTVLNSLPTFKEIGAGNQNAHFFNHTALEFSKVLLNLLEDTRSYRNSKAWLARYDIRQWAETYQGLARSVSGDE